MDNNNTITVSGQPNLFSFGFVKELLRGTGQVMFQGSAWTGLLFMIGIFWGAYAEGQGLVAWGALVGVIASTITGYLLGLPRKDGAEGLWGFNGVLVGCAFPTFMGSTVWMWLALILCAALTTWVRTGFNNVMAPWKVNSFTFPFVFCTWIFLLAARTMHGLPDTYMGEPSLPGAFASVENLGFGHLIVYWLKGIGQVFLIDSWVTGALFLIGLFLCSRWAALWAAIGSAVALFVALILKAPGADIAHGLYGFSPVLTAIALATVFYKPNMRSAVWALLGIVVTVFVQAGMDVMMAPVGIATLTGPFCITTWLFLLPLLKFDSPEKPDHSNWYKENKTHLYEQSNAVTAVCPDGDAPANGSKPVEALVPVVADNADADSTDASEEDRHPDSRTAAQGHETNSGKGETPEQPRPQRPDEDRPDDTRHDARDNRQNPSKNR